MFMVDQELIKVCLSDNALILYCSRVIKQEIFYGSYKHSLRAFVLCLYQIQYRCNLLFIRSVQCAIINQLKAFSKLLFSFWIEIT